MKKFAKAYIENGGQVNKAVFEAYPVKDKKNANTLGHALLEKPMVQEEIQRLLNKSGITLDYLNDNVKQAIELNLEQGKPQMGVAADLLKFMYKLHNVIPANKSMNLNYSRKEIINKPYAELKEDLEKMNKLTAKLLVDTA